MGITVARAVTEQLVAHHVRRAFTVPGESFLLLLDELKQHPAVTLVSVRHEGGAAFMAEAEGKLTGVPGLALASRGPGATNLSIGVHTARQDCAPMVAILGQVESTVLGRESFQEVDLAAFFRPIAKWSAQAATPQEVAPLVAEALEAATSGRPGPAVLAVPSDFWGHTVEHAVRSPAPPKTAPAEEVRRGVARLRSASHPVFIAGRGARASHDLLVDIAQRRGAPVYTAFRQQDAFPEDHPCYAGHLGLSVSAENLKALDAADLVVVLGTRLDQMTTQQYAYPRADQAVLLVREWELAEGEHAGETVTVTGSSVQFLRSVAADLIGAAPPAAVPVERADAAAGAPAAEPTDTTAAGVHPTTLVRTLRRLLPQDTIVTNDSGNFSGFVHQNWRFTRPWTQLGPANGAMGYAVPAAVAAALADPSRTVVAMVGDGGVLMTGQELETAVRWRLPIIVVVFQNGLYGTIAMHQARAVGRLSAVEIGALDLAGWARGLGALSLDRKSVV